MSTTNTRRLSASFLLLSFVAAACSEPHAALATPDELTRAEDLPITDVALAPYRARLVELAFDAVSAMPLEPHIKNRSRAQEAVIELCLELDQPLRARVFADEVANWRRGGVLADYASWCARNGRPDEARHAIELAAEVARTDESARSQAWRCDQIRAKSACAWLWLGESAEAELAAAELSPSEVGRVHAADAWQIDPELVAARLELTAAIAQAGDFDALRGMLAACVQLFDRFHEDDAQRAAVLEAVRAAWSKLPTSARIQLALELSQIALEHGAGEEALELLADAQAMFEGTRWMPEDAIPLRARAAGLRFRAGEEQAARAELDACLADYEAQRATIVDIYRAGVLRPVAEAFASAGDPAVALAIYAKALEAGFANPNARPRAEDFSATLCSMARYELEPDEDFWTRAETIRAALGQPW